MVGLFYHILSCLICSTPNILLYTFFILLLFLFIIHMTLSLWNVCFDHWSSSEVVFMHQLVSWSTSRPCTACVPILLHAPLNLFKGTLFWISASQAHSLFLFSSVTRCVCQYWSFIAYETGSFSTCSALK